jgi:carboxyl-terminal processing protease
MKKGFLIPGIATSIVAFSLIGITYSNWLAPAGQTIYQKMKIFTTVLQTIQRVYVEEVDPEQLINDAIRGMVKGLDPHTNYLTAEEVEEWSKTYQGYSGIGITFDIINDKITVMSVIEGGPSYRIGLMPGDRIIKINGENAIGMKRDDVPKKLMGPPGTTVRVTIEREGWDEPKEFTIVREKIHVESIPNALMLDKTTGYIRIARFSSTTGQELEKALRTLENQGMKQLILDLRGNSGGYLQAAVEVAEKFLPENKMIVYTKGRIPSAYREYYSSNSTKHRMMPLIVLIDHASASASEIVAGAVQDWDRGLIVGKASFGKGLVQTQYPFPDGSVLLITTARYYTPSGRLIQRDYTNKTWEDYYHEAYVDSVRNKMLKKLPKFKTFAGRTVYGGGGIFPDIWLENKEKAPSKFVIDLAYHPKRYVYSYSEKFLRNHPEIKRMDPKTFAEQYEIPDAAIEEFGHELIRDGFSAKLEDFRKNARDLKFLIKREIAYRLWGDDGQFYVNLQRDTVLKEAKQYFPDASKLLAMSKLPKR